MNLRARSRLGVPFTIDKNSRPLQAAFLWNYGVHLHATVAQAQRDPFPNARHKMGLAVGERRENVCNGVETGRLRLQREELVFQRCKFIRVNVERWAVSVREATQPMPGKYQSKKPTLPLAFSSHMAA